MVVETNHVFEKVRESIAKALELETNSVEMKSRLISDLGAESIDFLDIVFRLEKTFSIKIPRDDLFPEKIMTDAKYTREGKITSEGIELLKSRLVKVDFSSFEKDPLVAKLPDLFTVGMIVNYLERRLKDA